MFPALIESVSFKYNIQRALLMYVQGDSTSLQRVSEVRRFLEFFISYLFPQQINYQDFYDMSVKQRASSVESFLLDDSKISIISYALLNLIWSYSKNGNFDEIMQQVKKPEMVYSDRYIESTFSAAISVIFSCVILTMHTDSSGFTDQEFAEWISRNRSSECTSILKIIAGVES